MITATQFAHNYSSFWLENFPALKSYVRVINAGAYERVFDEYDASIEPSRASLISETAFCFLKNGEKSLPKAFREATVRIGNLPGAEKTHTRLKEQEKASVVELARRTKIMVEAISRDTDNITFDIEFAGCGALSRSYGDIFSNAVLSEVKSVDRGFRAVDFRQLMTYVLQNTTSKNYSIHSIAVINPRSGIFYKENIERFLFDTCAPNILDLQGKFVSSIGFGGLSR